MEAVVAVTFLLLLLAALVVLVMVFGIVLVRQAEAIVVERLGRFHKVLKPGINVLIPLIDSPRRIEWKYIKQDVSGKVSIERRKTSRIDLREIVYDFPRQNVITKDNVLIEINALVYFQITDPVKAVYEISNLPDAIEKLTQTTLRSVIGELDLDETLASREVINKKLRTILDEATDKWGVKVNRVELQDINPPKDIREAMEKQMRAERDRRAAILEAEGIKKSKILVAEGEAEARVKVATAEAEAISKIAQAVASEKGDPVGYLIAIRYIDALKEMVTGKGNKIVYLPYEATGVLGAVGSIRELFRDLKENEAAGE